MGGGWIYATSPLAVGLLGFADFLAGAFFAAVVLTYATFRVLIFVPPGPTDRMAMASFRVSLET